MFSRDGSPVSQRALDVLSAGMAGRGHCVALRSGCAGLGRAGATEAPEAHHGPSCAPVGRLVCVAAGRVDNVQELRRKLSIADHESSADADIFRHAYLTWGKACVESIYGDWSFAIWCPSARELFVARDHLGNTSVYYYSDERVFAFASERKALLALNLAPLEMDELHLAQVLVSWHAYHGEHTIHKPIRQLQPAHAITVTPERFNLRRYWRIEDTPLLRLPSREDYVLGFREVFDEAVRARLRSRPANGGGHGAEADAAVTLSGGLDSGSVAVTAAHLLKPVGRRLTAFTSVPLFETGRYMPGFFGDEFPLARETARFTGNVDHVPITAANLSPVRAVRMMLEICGEPAHSAGNFYWVLELLQTAAVHGHNALLTGQVGNAGISWTGDLFSQPLAFQLRARGCRRWAKERLRRITPFGLMKIWRRQHTPADWYRASAVNPAFAERLHLLERRLDDISESPRTLLEKRCWILKPSHSSGGALHAATGAAFGLEVRDPTADPRVLEFTFSVPDDLFMDPKTGLDRWLIREAMRDRLPDAVRLNRRRGMQAADLAPRLRACALEVDEALDDLARGPAAEYVDIPYMREVWRMVRAKDTPETFGKSVTVLMRGIMAGLWVNDFCGSSREEGRDTDDVLIQPLLSDDKSSVSL